MHDTRFTTRMKVSMVCLGNRIFGLLRWRIVSSLTMTGRVLRKVGGLSLFQVRRDRAKNDRSLFFSYHPQGESPNLGARIFRKMESTTKVSQAAKRIMHCENHSRGCTRVCGLRAATELDLVHVSPSFTCLIISFWGLILLSFFKMGFTMCSLMVAYQCCITWYAASLVSSSALKYTHQHLKMSFFYDSCFSSHTCWKYFLTG